MKQLFILLFAVAAFVGCEKEKDNLLDPNAMIAINPAPDIKAETNPKHLSAKEIVEQATILSFWNTKFWDQAAQEREFGDHQKDFINHRLLMAGFDIIQTTGALELWFIEGSDFLVEAWYDRGKPEFRKDTIAYIPNAVIRAAEVKIKEAYANKDYKECYRLMDEAFTYTPITAAEWRALKAAGNN